MQHARGIRCGPKTFLQKPSPPVQEVSHTKKLSIFVIALLICSLGFAFTGIENASAATAQNPKWVKIYMLKPLHVRMTKQGRPEVKVRIKYVNNSTDKVITRIYDKTLKLNYGYRIDGINDGAVYTVGGSRLWTNHRSTKVNRVQIDPGQSCILYYWVKLGNKRSEYSIASMKNFTVDNALFKSLKWSHSYKIKYEGI